MLNSKNPIRLQIELTSVCKLKCKMCPLTEGKTIASRSNNRFIKNETFEKVFEIAKDVQQVLLIGFGEVFLHPRVKEILALLDRNNVVIGLSTNGTTLSKEICDFLCSLTGLQNINVSVDSFDSETYRAIRGSSNKKMLQGLQNLSDSQLKADQVTLPFVCLNSNFQLLSGIPEKVKNLGFNHIVLQSIVEHTDCDTRVSVKNSQYLYEEFLKQCKDLAITVTYCGRQTLEEQVAEKKHKKNCESQYGTKQCLVP